MSLDSFFKAEKPEATAAAEPTPETPAEQAPAAVERARDEAGRFAKGEATPEPKVEAKAEAKVEEKPAATPAAKEPKDKTPEAGLAAGIAAERAKRQEAERRAAEIERRFAELEAKTKAPPPDPLQDPQGFQRHLQTEVQTVAQRLQQQALTDRLNMSEAIARAAHPDLDEAFAVFQEEAQSNHALAHQAMQQQHPWEWVYQQGKKLQLLREIGNDPNAWREAERERIRAELAQQQSASPRREAEPPPPSLAAARSGRVSEPVWSGPSSLSSVLKGR